jgi:hypothetical protein
MKKFPSKSAGNFSTKVWMQKVKLICISPGSQSTTDKGYAEPLFNQGSLENFTSKSAENFSIRV